MEQFFHKLRKLCNISADLFCTFMHLFACLLCCQCVRCLVKSRWGVGSDCEASFSLPYLKQLLTSFLINLSPLTLCRSCCSKQLCSRCHPQKLMLTQLLQTQFPTADTQINRSRCSESLIHFS